MTREECTKKNPSETIPNEMKLKENEWGKQNDAYEKWTIQQKLLYVGEIKKNSWKTTIMHCRMRTFSTHTGIVTERLIALLCFSLAKSYVEQQHETQCTFLLRLNLHGIAFICCTVTMIEMASMTTHWQHCQTMHTKITAYSHSLSSIFVGMRHYVYQVMWCGKPSHTMPRHNIRMQTQKHTD